MYKHQKLINWLRVAAWISILVLWINSTYRMVKSYADTHTPMVTRYCVQAISVNETLPYWGDPITDEFCVYANPVTSHYKDGTLMVNGSFGLAQFVVDLFPTKDRWTDTFGAQKYRARVSFVTEDWIPFGPQWGVELVYNIGVPDWQIEQGWTLKIGNTTGGKGFETYIGADGECYIREIPDSRVIKIFVPVK